MIGGRGYRSLHGESYMNKTFLVAWLVVFAVMMLGGIVNHGMLLQLSIFLALYLGYSSDLINLGQSS